MNDLAKRTAGAPLTEAEHAQRVAAARARWTAGALGAGAAAAVAAGVASAIRIKRQRTADTAEVRQVLRPVKATRTANLRRAARVATATAAIDAGLAPTGGAKFLRRAAKTMQSQARRADLEVARHFNETAETRVFGSTDDGHPIEERVTGDIEGMAARRDEANALKVRLTDLRENGRAAQTTHVEAGIVHPVAAYTRIVQVREPKWSKLAQEKLEHLLEAFGEPPPIVPQPPAPPAAPTPAPAGPAPAAAVPTAEDPFGNIPQLGGNARQEAHDAWRRALHDGFKTLSAEDQAHAWTLTPKQNEVFLSKKLGLKEPPRPVADRPAARVNRPAADQEAMRQRLAEAKSKALAEKRAKLSPARQAQFDRLEAARAVSAAEKAAARSKGSLDSFRDIVGSVLEGAASADPFADVPYAEPHEIKRVLGNIRSLNDVVALTRGMSAANRNGFLDYHLLPRFTIVERPREVHVAAIPARGRAASSKRTPGYPDPETRRTLAEELRRDVDGRARTWQAAERAPAAARVAQARAAVRPAASKPLRRLKLLGGRNRYGLIGGAAALAGLGGYLAVRGVQNALGKHAGQARDPLGRFAAGAGRGHTTPQMLGTNPYRTDFARKGEPPRVTMLVGMPGSGKSTWRAMRMAQAAIRPTTVISTDEKIEDIGRQWGLPFSEAFKLIDHKQVDREHRAALRVALRAGHDVIIDRVNASPTGRAKWLRRVPAHYESHAVVFHVPEHELRARRARRAGKVIPGHALGEMRDAYKAPTAEEFDFVHHVRPEQAPLAKAAPDPTHPQAAAAAAEAEMAQRLAAMFGRWTDGAEAALASNTPGVLTSGMSGDLDEALKPLDAALRAGAGVPVLSGEGGKTIAFSFLARDPKVTAYIDAYRKDKIVELVDEQRAAIKEQLMDAARTGASPDAMARRIRETIGLTSTQMQHVQNYREELETLQGGALKRELRDRRFDKPIIRALATGTPIAPDKIDQYVDAYHRRYLAFRAMTIARTEGVGAANNGQAAAAAILVASQPGMDVEKTWMTQMDGHERDDHHELNGKTVVGLDTPFRCESGDLVRWPHDPRAPARQIIRCRCAWIPKLVPRPESPDSQAN